MEDVYITLLKKIGECVRVRLEPLAAQGTASALRRIGDDLDFYRTALRARSENPAYWAKKSPAFEYVCELYLYLKFQPLVDALRNRDDVPPTKTEQKAVFKCLSRVGALCGPYF